MFYAMGTGTDGKMYWSKDMILWDGPTLVAKSDKAQWLNDSTYGSGGETYPRIGAGDLMYHNGIFHIYYNGIGHSVSQKPTQMFSETSITTPFTTFDIDPQLYIEEDGTPIFIKKVQGVHPITGEKLGTAPKQTWQFPLQTPFSFGADVNIGDKQGRFLNSGLKGSNDHIDKNNFEGPELYKYRANYYLLNSTSCMSARTGYYNAYCTQSTSLNTMDNSSKVPEAVLERNLEKFHRQYQVIAPFSEWKAWNGRLSTTTPPSTWMDVDFDDSSWQQKEMGMGAPEQDRGVDIRHVRTLWNSNWKTVYVRREFIVEAIPQKPFLLYRLEGNFAYYLNGKPLFIENGSYIGWRTKEIPASAFVVGKNVLSVKCTAVGKTNYFDVGVYDARSLSVEDPVMGPSQTNLLLGLNGFEHFMVYKAFWNGISSQGVDRVFFQGRDLVCDGPTTSNSNGYHPVPSKPSLFLDFSSSPAQKYWDYAANDWQFTGNRGIPKAASSVLMNKTKAQNYFIETSFALPKTGNATAGFMVWYQDVNNYLQVLISRSTMSWILNSMEKGELTTTQAALPAKFMFFEPNAFIQEVQAAIHELKVYKNNNKVNVWLDHFLLTAQSPIQVASNQPGYCGILANGSGVYFNHFAYTKGWDEYGDNITGWNGNLSLWKLTDAGLRFDGQTTTAEMLYKGDKLSNTNFEINVSNASLPVSGQVFIQPLYTDSENYVQAIFDYASKKWLVSGKMAGNNIERIELNATVKRISVHTSPLTYTQPLTSYTYNLKGENSISEIGILWMEGKYPFLSANFNVPNKTTVQYKSGNQWISVSDVVMGKQQLGVYNHIRFAPVTTSALRIVTVPIEGQNCRPYHIEVTADLSSTFFFRSLRSNGKLMLFYNNELMATLNYDFPASQVGFGTNIKDCIFDGMMCYQNQEMGDEELFTSISSVEKQKDTFRIYSANKTVCVEPNNNLFYRTTIYDLAGKQVWANNKARGKKTFLVDGLSNAVYIVHVTDSTKNERTEKVEIR